MAIIAIEEMTFHAFHGCMEEERKIGNTFVVDLYLEADTGKAEISDKLSDTTDYSEAFNIVKEEMETPSKLLEHAGRRIINKLKLSFPEIESVEIKVAKKSPPISGQADSVSVTLFEDFDEFAEEI
jgi:dihydroneopterin aldolase